MVIGKHGRYEWEDDGSISVQYIDHREVCACTDNRRMYKFFTNQRTYTGTCAHKPLHPANCKLQIVPKWEEKDESVELGILAEISRAYSLC